MQLLDQFHQWTQHQKDRSLEPDWWGEPLKEHMRQRMVHRRRQHLLGEEWLPIGHLLQSAKRLNRPLPLHPEVGEADAAAFIGPAPRRFQLLKLKREWRNKEKLCMRGEVHNVLHNTREEGLSLRLATDSKITPRETEGGVTLRLTGIEELRLPRILPMTVGVITHLPLKDQEGKILAKFRAENIQRGRDLVRSQSFVRVARTSPS